MKNADLEAVDARSPLFCYRDQDARPMAGVNSNSSRLPEAAFEPLETSKINYFMTPERWRQLEGLYDAVKDLSPAERSAASERCRPGSTLRNGSNLGTGGIGAGRSCLGGSR